MVRWRRLRDGDAGGRGRRGPGAPGPGRRRALQALLRPVPRNRRRPRAQPRAIPRHVTRPRADGDGIRLDGDHGQQPIGRRAARHRRVPDRPDVCQRAQHRPGPARDVRRPAPGVRSRPRPGVERLGQRHLEQPVPDGRQGRAGRGRRAEAEAEVGVRLSWRSAVLLAGHRRRRAPVRRQLGRQGLLAERGDRLHPLVLRRG